MNSMKFNKIILALLVVFILTSGTSIIFAEQFELSDVSFDIPGNYSINKTTDEACILKSDNADNYTISMIQVNSSDAILEKNSRMSSGFKFLSEEKNTSSNGIDINQQNFMKNESYFSFYSFEAKNLTYMVIYTFPVHDEAGNATNPVNEIIESIQ